MSWPTTYDNINPITWGSLITSALPNPDTPCGGVDYRAHDACCRPQPACGHLPYDPDAARPDPGVLNYGYDHACTLSTTDTPGHNTFRFTYDGPGSARPDGRTGAGGGVTLLQAGPTPSGIGRPETPGVAR